MAKSLAKRLLGRRKRRRLPVRCRGSRMYRRKGKSRDPCNRMQMNTTMIRL